MGTGSTLHWPILPYASSRGEAPVSPAPTWTGDPDDRADCLWCVRRWSASRSSLRLAKCVALLDSPSLRLSVSAAV